VKLLPDQVATILKDGTITGPGNLPAPRVRVSEGMRARVFYDREINRLAFGFKPPDQGSTATFQIAAHPAFETLLLGEPVTGGSFAAPVRPGRIYWRILRRAADGTEAMGATGSLEIARDPLALRSAATAASNVVPDTGIQTTILFQGKVPALTFKWDALESATGYRLRIFSEDNLEKPVFEDQATEPRMVLGAGKLVEGTYFWYQAALDAQGKEIKASQMNKLLVTFDNAAPLLRIESPVPGAARQNGIVELRGTAAAGSILSVNGTPIQLSPDGRFKQVLSNVAPFEQLVFHVRKPGAGDVFFTRQVGR
jgi:hypothetical protein